METCKTPCQVIYEPNQVITLTATPIAGKSFRQWEIYDPNYPGDANYAILDANASLTLVMSSDRHVGAVFKCGSGVTPALPLLMMGFLVLRLRWR